MNGIAGMNIEGARRVMETTSAEVANQYLRFGWNLINQYYVEATPDQPAMVKYVLAFVRKLEDTREIAIIEDPAEVNQYLIRGWKLVDKHVTNSDLPDGRHERIHFVLAWQTDDEPLRPGTGPEVSKTRNASPIESNDDS